MRGFTKRQRVLPRLPPVDEWTDARLARSKVSTRDTSMRSYRRFCSAFQVAIIGGGAQKELSHVLFG